MNELAGRLADWMVTYRPDEVDRTLAHRSLVDTVSVALAAREQPLLGMVGHLSRVERWAVAAHLLDFDDLHLPSTSHISTVCVPVALDVGGGEGAFLVGAGVMARLGAVLGDGHYSMGWHTTSTAGCIAAAAAAGHVLGFDEALLTQAMAMAVAGAGGIQAAFGSDGKALQVAQAAAAGTRAAHLVASGARIDPAVLDTWVRMVGGDASAKLPESSAVPGGLAIKLFPCCYALQRPIGATAEVSSGLDLSNLDDITQIRVRTRSSTVKPLIHHRPRTGLEAKFSLEYAVAATLIDGFPGFGSFTDAAVSRPEAQSLLRRVEIETLPGGEGLLEGATEIALTTRSNSINVQMIAPPGSPANPATDAQLHSKWRDCLAKERTAPGNITWSCAPALLDSLFHFAGSDRTHEAG